ncbi:MAG: hypothetical protein H7A39_01370 [Chlamydiales bacterium]|nr:hypothetical protein [Chlamydiales bacterium]
MKKPFLLFILCWSFFVYSHVPFRGCKRCIQRNSNLRLLEAAYLRNHYEKAPNETLKIPKIIHQIWFGKPMPEAFRKMTETWKHHHPDWEYRLWTDEDLASFPLVTGNQIFKTKNLGQRSDIFRLEVLNRFGGLYVDTDFVCIKPHDCFHMSADFYAGLENSVVGNALIGSTPKHPILSTCLKAIQRIKSFSPQFGQIQNTTGPMFLTRVVTQHLRRSKNHRTIVYPCSYFFPLHCDLRMEFWNSDQSLDFLKPYIKVDTHSAHLWAASWTTDGKAPGKA